MERAIELANVGLDPLIAVSLWSSRGTTLSVFSLPRGTLIQVPCPGPLRQGDVTLVRVRPERGDQAKLVTNVGQRAGSPAGSSRHCRQVTRTTK